MTEIPTIEGISVSIQNGRPLDDPGPEFLIRQSPAWGMGICISNSQVMMLPGQGPLPTSFY